MQNVIETAKKLINLPYNKFNLENYLEILQQYFDVDKFDTDSYLPIKRMSGQNPNSGIVNNLNEKDGKIIIVGKGILFDSGGLNLKIGKHINNMYADKAGMIVALAVAENRKNVIAYCPVTTNFIQTSQISPGDIIEIKNKKICVNNTDAEGRLILAEALSTLRQNSNDIIITVATLTGCVGDAIDKKATGVFTPNDKLAQLYLEASAKAKEYAWRLPLFDYMQDFYKKQPILNAEDKIQAGASEGAMFVKQFVKFPNNWIHLDIAYSAFDKNNKANGVPIKSLIKFIERIK